MIKKYFDFSIRYSPTIEGCESLAFFRSWDGDVYYYEFIDKERMRVYTNRDFVGRIIERKDLKSLKYYIRKVWNKKITRYKPKKNSVLEILRPYAIHKLPIAMESSRVLGYSHPRECLAYTKTPNSIVMFFRKRGGILAYHIGATWYSSMFEGWRCYQLTLSEGLKILKEFEEFDIPIYLPEKVEYEIQSKIFMENL